MTRRFGQAGIIVVILLSLAIEAAVLISVLNSSNNQRQFTSCQQRARQDADVITFLQPSLNNSIVLEQLETHC
jgi:hypothetical protein